jgi:hypothetical protein
LTLMTNFPELLVGVNQEITMTFRVGVGVAEGLRVARRQTGLV